MVPSTSSRKAILLKSEGSEGSTFGMSCIRATIVEAVAPKVPNRRKDTRKRDNSPRQRYNLLIPRRFPQKISAGGRRHCGRCGSNADEVARSLYGCLRPKAPCRHRRGEAAR